MALSRPVTALDNERFTVQSVMLQYAVPVVLVREAGLAGQGRGPGNGGASGPDSGERVRRRGGGAQSEMAGAGAGWGYAWAEEGEP